MIPLILLAINANVIYGAGIVCAAFISAVTAFLTAHFIPPSQKRQLEAQTRADEVSAAEAAVRSVREALTESQLKIGRMERRINELITEIGVLRGQLKAADNNRVKLEERLNLSIAERGVLKQRVIDLELKAVDTNGKPDAIVMVGETDGLIDYASSGVFNLLGYTPGELIGKSIDMLVPEHLREIHAHERDGFAHHPRMRPMGTGIELLARKRDGTVIPVDISLVPTGDGRVLALLKQTGTKKTQAP